MLRYFIKRLLGMIPTLIIVAVCVFFFIHLLPGGTFGRRSGS